MSVEQQEQSERYCGHCEEYTAFVREGFYLVCINGCGCKYYIHDQIGNSECQCAMCKHMG